MPISDNILKSPDYRSGALALVLAVGAIVTALGFEHLGGYTPCPLCLMERWAYYASIPALFVSLILIASGQRRFAGALLLLVSLAFLANAGLGVYHAGAEWKFWPGPDTCGGSGAITTQAGGLLKQLENVRVIRCDEAPWRMLGLSFAGWNVVASFLLWIISLKAAFATNDPIA